MLKTHKFVMCDRKSGGENMKKLFGNIEHRLHGFCQRKKISCARHGVKDN